VDSAADEHVLQGAARDALQSVLPACVRWRTTDDVLSQQPAGSEQGAVCSLNCSAETCGEDAGGAVSANLLLGGGAGAAAIEWVVFAASERPLLSEHCRTCSSAAYAAAALRDAPCPFQLVTQQPGELLLLPPCAVFARCPSPGAQGATPRLLQWLRVDAACAWSALGLSKAPVFPPYAPLPPLWRQLQLAPLTKQATYLTLVKRVQSYAGAGGDAGPLAPVDEDAELLLLLRCASALLRSEETSSAVAVGQLDSHAPRACDLCRAEIFNRCMRIDKPVFGDGSEAVVVNPRRASPRRPGAGGEFCLRCVAGGRVAAAPRSRASLQEHAPHERLKEVVEVARKLLEAADHACDDGDQAVVDGEAVGRGSGAARVASSAVSALGRVFKPVSAGHNAKRSQAASLPAADSARDSSKRSRAPPSPEFAPVYAPARDVHDVGAMEVELGGDPLSLPMPVNDDHDVGALEAELGGDPLNPPAPARDDYDLGDLEAELGGDSLPLNPPAPASDDHDLGDLEAQLSGDPLSPPAPASDEHDLGDLEAELSGDPAVPFASAGDVSGSGRVADLTVAAAHGASRFGSAGAAYRSGLQLGGPDPELKDVLASSEFKDFLRLCQSNGVGLAPADVPLVALKYVRHLMEKRLKELGNARDAAVAEQRAELGTLLGRRGGQAAQAPAERHARVNRLLALTQAGINEMAAEVGRVRRVAAEHERELNAMLGHDVVRQQQEPVQQQQQWTGPCGAMGNGGSSCGAGAQSAAGPGVGGSSADAAASGHWEGDAYVMEIPNDPPGGKGAVSFLIGQKGASINVIQDQCATRVQIEKLVEVRGPKRRVWITGTRDACLRCAQMVSDKMADFVEREEKKELERQARIASMGGCGGNGGGGGGCEGNGGGGMPIGMGIGMGCGSMGGCSSMCGGMGFNSSMLSAMGGFAMGCVGIHCGGCGSLGGSVGGGGMDSGALLGSMEAMAGNSMGCHSGMCEMPMMGMHSTADSACSGTPQGGVGGVHSGGQQGGGRWGGMTGGGMQGSMLAGGMQADVSGPGMQDQMSGHAGFNQAGMSPPSDFGGLGSMPDGMADCTNGFSLDAESMAGWSIQQMQQMQQHLQQQQEQLNQRVQQHAMLQEQNRHQQMQMEQMPMGAPSPLQQMQQPLQPLQQPEQGRHEQRGARRHEQRGASQQQRGAGLHEHTIHIPLCALGLVIGKGGENLKAVKNKTGAYVGMLPDERLSGGERSARVSAPDANALQRAVAMVEGHIERAMDNEAKRCGGTPQAAGFQVAPSPSRGRRDNVDGGGSARDASHSRDGGGGWGHDGGRSGGRQPPPCHVCNEDGHAAHECPHNNWSSGGGGGRDLQWGWSPVGGRHGGGWEGANEWRGGSRSDGCGGRGRHDDHDGGGHGDGSFNPRDGDGGGGWQPSAPQSTSFGGYGVPPAN